MPVIEAVAADVYDVAGSYTSEIGVRTNIEIDDDLLREAMIVTGKSTKKETVEEALRRVVNYARQVEALKAIAGSVPDLGDDYRELRGKRKRY
jgi:Arc/MetJ family transcription regulator